MIVPGNDPRFGFTDEQWAAIGRGWLQLLDDNHLEVVATEARVVNDEFRRAGSVDRYAKAGAEMRYVFPDIDDPENGEPFMAVVEPGDVVTIDAKTSKLWESRSGLPDYWDGYPLQILTYNEAVGYDVRLEERYGFGFETNKDVAFIAHFNVDELLTNNRVVWQLIAVDMRVARRGADAVMKVQEYEKMQKFAMSPTKTVIELDPMAPLKKRAEELAAGSPELWAEFVALGVDMKDPDAVKAGLDHVDPFAQPSKPPAKRAPLGAAKPTRVAPDDGAVWEGAPPWKAKYQALSVSALGWVTDRVVACARAGHGVQPSVWNERAVYLVGSFVLFADAFVDGDPEEDADLGLLFAACVGTDDWESAVPMMGAAEAKVLMTTVHGLTTGRIVASLSDDGSRFILSPVG